MLLGVKAKLVPSGPVKLLVNGENEVEVSSGDTLLSTLSNNKIFLPSACGGGGTCIQCKCIISGGGGEILPTEGLYNRIIQEVEIPLIKLTLNACNGNQLKCAKILGINRNTLRKKLKLSDISVTKYK